MHRIVWKTFLSIGLLTALVVLVASSAGASATLGPPVAQLTAVKSVSAGVDTTCAVVGSKRVAMCWGQNYRGELGNGESTGPRLCHLVPCSPTPYAVHGLNNRGTLRGVKQLVVGNSQVCALLLNSTAACWGSNFDGGLGDGSFSGPQRCVVSNIQCSTFPRIVKNPLGTGPLIGITELSAGSGAETSYEVCARLTNGKAVCWGSNASGDLGDGSGVARSALPRFVLMGPGGAKLAGVVQVSVGQDFVCALLTSNLVDCWGANSDGELGNGTLTAGRFPGPVLSLTGVAQISAGGFHACALLLTGEVECWGANATGELGDGLYLGPQTCPGGDPGGCSTSPVTVTTSSDVALTSVAQIASSETGACARTSRGSVDCWGWNYYGQLGVGEASGPQVCWAGACSMTARLVQNENGDGPLASVSGLSSGFWNTECAIVSAGALRCWGLGQRGQLGTGAIPPNPGYSDLPVTVIS